MRLCIMGATFNTSNMGVSALTSGIIETILYQYPDAEIRLLDYGREPITYDYSFRGRVVPIRLINLRFSKRVFLKNNVALLLFLSMFIKVIPFKRWREKAYSWNEYLSSIQEADIFLSIAGGDSFSDIYGMGRLCYVSLPQLLVLLMGKKIVLLPQTLGPFKSSTARLLARFILKRAQVIYSRDYMGLKGLNELLGKRSEISKQRVCYDLGFVIDPVRPCELVIDGINIDEKNEQPIVGVNVSGLLFMGGYRRNNMFGLKCDYREIVYEVIRLILIEKNARVLLIPHVFGERENSESDAVVCEKLYQELRIQYEGQIASVVGPYNQSEIKYIIGKCDFFVGSRMHACIAALSQCIPAVAIAYSEKFIGVLRTIGMDSLVADPRIMNRADIRNAVAVAYDNRRLLHYQLSQTIPKVKDTIHNLMVEINEMCQIDSSCK